MLGGWDALAVRNNLSSLLTPGSIPCSPIPSLVLTHSLLTLARASSFSQAAVDGMYQRLYADPRTAVFFTGYNQSGLMKQMVRTTIKPLPGRHYHMRTTMNPWLAHTMRTTINPSLADTTVCAPP